MVSCAPLILDPSICNFLVGTIFPWIFSFAIVYGLVLRSKVFGETADTVARGVAGLIGVVVAFLVTMAAGPTIASFLTSVSGTVIMYATIILGIVMLFAIVNPGLLGEFKEWKGLAIIIVLILIAGLIVSGFTPGITTIQITQDLAVLLVTLLLLAGIVWFVTRGGGTPAPKTEG
jgi:hypothetical protein